MTTTRCPICLLVAKLTGLFGSGFPGALLKTMGMACSDPLVNIRKAAVSALSETFRKFPDESVTTEWLHSVPRLITDNESSIQEEYENLFLELVIDRICRSRSVGLPHDRATPNGSNAKVKSFEMEFELLLPEGVLGLLREICNGEVTPWKKKICTSLGKKNKLKHKIALALQNEFLLHHWQLLDKYGSGVKIQSPHVEGVNFEEEEDVESKSVARAGDRVFLLQTISNVSIELPSEPAAELAHNLFKRLDEFNMHSTEVKAHVKALKTLCKRKALSPQEAEILVMKWIDPLLSKASKILEKCISKNSEAKRKSSYSTPPAKSGSSKSKKEKAMSRSLSQAITAVYTSGSLVIHCPSTDMSNIIPLLHTIITSGNSDPKLNKLPGAGVSFMETAPSLYIQA
ncbi:hypothetical protein TIFTF001_052894 [Ficus carica]|uniref:Uncharacterized protein n=1 Tax=Ficus carica TaxID=3494 RepID=A0AA88EDC4_FICCA|nr:hypothetical protein TIFTF001_052893 [Ficus carica]GMN72686.1 hypothetical protein TIFTF001_052894 [Ficus carica]